MAGPLISVIMPAFNCEDFIAQSIASVLAQDYENFELIIVDDGSTDRTVDIARSFGPPVTVMQQSNGGAAAARNHGMEAARGEYIGFLDADDIWHPQKLSSQCAYIEDRPRVGLVYSDWQEWHPDSNGQWSVPVSFTSPITSSIPDEALCGWLYSKLLLDCVLHTITVLMRKEVVDRTGKMSTHLVNGEDYDYWLRVSRNYEIHKLRDVVALYRIRPESLARKVYQKNYELEVVESALKTWGAASPDGTTVTAKQLERRIANLCFDFAYRHFHGGDVRIAQRASIRAIRTRPLWPTGWKYLLLSSMKRFAAPTSN
jgi:glycosyltransferase involved in cell wall biosynthesis